MASEKEVHGGMATGNDVQGGMATGNEVQGEMANENEVQGEMATGNDVQGEMARENEVQRQMASEKDLQVVNASENECQGGVANETEKLGAMKSENVIHGGTFSLDRDEKVVNTQPKPFNVKPFKRKKRFHLTRVQAEILAWFSICCCCWPLGVYALLCACQARVADDEEEYERRLVWSTWCGIAGLVFNITIWPLIAILFYFTL